MFDYSEDIFEELYLAIEEDQNSFKWLMQNSYKELGAFVLALRGRPDAVKWLNENNYAVYALTVLAIKREVNPFKALTKLPDKKMACLVGVVHQDANCMKYLKEKNLELVLELGFVIRRSIIS